MKEREYLFYQWSLPEIGRHFAVDFDQGLRLDESLRENVLDIKEDNRALRIFLRQFLNFFVYILGAAAFISYILDGFLQASILILIIFSNVILGFLQEFKAEKALAELKNSFKSKSLVLRKGKVFHINSEELNLGDIVLLEAGDKIPADIRIIECNNLKINESALTGESVPVSKEEKVLHIDTPLPDRTNMLYASTHVISGNAKGIVVATGIETEFGKVAGLIETKEDKTPLEKKIIYLSKLITIFSVIVTSLIFFLGLWRGYNFLPLLTMVIALLVGAVPESLPTIITLALAIGVSKMAAKKAIVRKMAVIETLGTTDIIATDKTGTLTNNHLVLEKILLNKDEDLVEKDPSSDQEDVISFLKDAILCTNLNFNKKFMGDPLDVAIAEKLALYHEEKVLKAITAHKKLDLPFDSKEKFSAVRISNKGFDHIYAKGASEKILEFCSLSKEHKKQIILKSEELSKQGLKTIALAKKEVSEKTGTSFVGFHFCGLLAFVDEPADGVKEAISKVVAAGIRPIIITGDHAETARFIASKIGIEVEDSEIISSIEFSSLNKKDLKKAIEKVKIFARVSPEQKIQIVKLLNEKGYSVTVTGDGVNDAPALKEASVGISMGKKGTDIAREASDIILADDKYSTIITAIEYGRCVYDNIKNSITFLLSGNFSEVLLIAFAFLFDLPIPLLTIQILWINLVTDSLPAIAMAFEEPDSKLMAEKPRSKKENSLKSALVYAFVLALIGFIFSLGLYLWGLHSSIIKARTIVFTGLVVIELLFGLSIRSNHRIWQRPIAFIANKYMLASILLAVSLQSILFLPNIRKVFDLVNLSGKEISIILIVGLFTFLVAELFRFFFDRSNHKK